MAIRYQFPTDDEPAGVLFGTPLDGDDWFASPYLHDIIHGIAVAALAAIISTSAIAGATANLHQDDPAGSLYGQSDEDFWTNAVSPVAASQYQRLPYLPDPEEIPAGNLFGPMSVEDLDIRALIGAPRPVPATTSWQSVPQWLYDVQEPAGSLYGQSDEDFWLNPVAPSVARLLWPQQCLFDEQIPAGSLFGQAAEDFWLNPVRPISLTFWQSLPYFFDAEEIVPPPAAFFPDEDFWNNPVASVQATNLWPQAWTFDVQEPAGSLYGQFGEDFWLNPVRPVTATVFQALPYWFDTDEIVSQIFRPEEDFWQNLVRPVPASFRWPQVWTFGVPTEDDLFPTAPPQIVAVGRSARFGFGFPAFR